MYMYTCLYMHAVQTLFKKCVRIGQHLGILLKTDRTQRDRSVNPVAEPGFMGKNDQQ